MASGFAAQVNAWALASEARMLAVFKRAAELLADELQRGRHNGGAVPYDLGNMVRSLNAVRNGNVMVSDAETPPAGDPGAQIAMLELGDVIHLGYQAIYAYRQNYGFAGKDSLGRSYNQAGAHFVEKAAALWPELVMRAATELASA